MTAACRLSTAGPYHPGSASQPGMLPSRGISKSSLIVPPPVLPLTCDHHGWDGGPWAFPRASHPTDQEPTTHVAVGTGRTQTRSYVPGIHHHDNAGPRPDLLTSSLNTCDLVSQHSMATRRLPLDDLLRPHNQDGLRSFFATLKPSWSTPAPGPADTSGRWKSPTLSASTTHAAGTAVWVTSARTPTKRSTESPRQTSRCPADRGHFRVEVSAVASGGRQPRRRRR